MIKMINTITIYIVPIILNLHGGLWNEGTDRRGFRISERRGKTFRNKNFSATLGWGAKVGWGEVGRLDI